MVCDRCKKVVREEFEKLGFTPSHLELGTIELIEEPDMNQLNKIREVLLKNGFELLEDQRQTLTEQIRTLIIEEIQHLKGMKAPSQNFSDYLSEKTGYDYSYLSHLFSAETGTTIEQYLIAQRVEKIKEWLSYDQLSASEMAWKLGYSSTAHLSNQFKKVTGMTPGQYKKSHEKNRRPLDQL